MEFIKNFNKDFILSPEFDLFGNVYGRLPLTNFNQPPLRVRIDDIDMRSITFGMTLDSQTLTYFTDKVADALLAKLKEGIAKDIISAQKVLKAWEETPEEFKRQDRTTHKNVYNRRGLLTDSEYHRNAAVWFDKIYIGYDMEFATGCGGNTYYDKEYFQTKIDGVDKWLEKQEKEMLSAKFKKRISNYISKTAIRLTYEDVEKYISIPEETAETKPVQETTEKPSFPMKLTADFLNSLLCEIDGALVDAELIQWVKEEYDVDISVLEDWEISIEHEGHHNHDGQVCDYTVVFMSPDGIEYCLYNSHCLVTGWNFHKEENLIPE